MPVASKGIVALGARKRGVNDLFELAGHLQKLGYVAVVDLVTSRDVGASACRKANVKVTKESARKKPLLAVALGGDGSFIQHAARYAPMGVPIIGINLGKVGFLADISPADMLPKITEVLAGKYQDEKRVMLEVEHYRHGLMRSKQVVINDVVIDRGRSGNVIEMDVAVSKGKSSVRMRGDGLILSTPGGSTAYNLAAGGPIITPDAGCVVLTPLSPYSLNHRPLVFSETHAFTITVANHARLMPDGEYVADLVPGDQVKIHTHKCKMTMRHPRGYDYLGKLTEKLYWRYN